MQQNILIGEHQTWENSKNKNPYKHCLSFSNQEDAYKETSLWYKVIKRNSHFKLSISRKYASFRKDVKPVVNVKQNVLVTGKVQSRHVQSVFI